MATAATESTVQFATVGQLLEYVPGIPPSRIRLLPTPGGASEDDIVRLWEEQKILCELFDGVLVEKPMAYTESVISYRIGAALAIYLKTHDLGLVAGEAGMLRIAARRVRSPDVSFVSWEQLPNRRLPREAIFSAHPDLAVEVLSPSNTQTEMTRKISEYFAAGTRLVWIVNPDDRTVTIYTSPEPGEVLQLDQTLTGGDLLPAFELPRVEIFSGL
jgi:Uma2 family endonuclease